MKILLTAFEPFDGETINPSQEAIKEVADNIAGANIIKLNVPVVFDLAGQVVYEAMRKEKPDVVFCIGQAGGRKGLTLERVAINVQDTIITDNNGNKPIDKKCFIDGPNAYFSSLPIKTIVEEINKEGILASISNSAGTYVCNDLMYTVLHHINKEFPNTIGGFMHVPFLPEQVISKPNIPSLTKDEIVKGIEVAIKTIVKLK